MELTQHEITRRAIKRIMDEHYTKYVKNPSANNFTNLQEMLLIYQNHVKNTDR